jgi:predicted ester cyclase
LQGGHYAVSCEDRRAEEGAPTGKRMDVEETFFLMVEDGKFVDFWALEDGLNRLRQLGLMR